MPLDWIFLADVRNQLENPQLRQVEEVEKGLSLLDDEIVLLMEGWYKTKVVYKKGWLDFKPAWWMCIMSIFTNHVYSKQINYISYIYSIFPGGKKQETNFAACLWIGNRKNNTFEDWLNQHQFTFEGYHLWRLVLMQKSWRTTLPKTNSEFTTENRPGPKRKRSYSNHPFSGAMLVSGRAITWNIFTNSVNDGMNGW